MEKKIGGLFKKKNIAKILKNVIDSIKCKIEFLIRSGESN
jgi:hypothetical protein